LNLYSNALKYSKRGGFVKIIVDIANQTDPLKRSNKLIKITVWDNGLGISTEN
jgi:signal transduction histidine kinase